MSAIPIPHPSRRFDEPIESLPRPRNSIRDRHHLFWPGAIMRGLGLSDFRDMACTSARGLDSLVHSIVHQRFSGITQFAQVDHLTDFRQRTDVAIQRHEDRQCGCIDRDRLLVVDALTLEAMTPDRFLGPSCTGLAVDRGVYKLMRDYYATVAPVTERVRTELADRCQNGACACYVQGAFRPPIWLPRAA